MKSRVAPELYFFDIPIYWCEEKTFNKRYQDKLNRYEETLRNQLGQKGEEYHATEGDRRIFHDIHWEQLKGPWRFNQIVGWVRVYRLGCQLRGEFWLIKAKRIGWQVTKKQFTHNGKAFELWMGDTKTSKQIFNKMLQSLRAFERELPGLVLDLECFETLGRFVNWRRLMNSHSA